MVVLFFFFLLSLYASEDLRSITFDKTAPFAEDLRHLTQTPHTPVALLDINSITDHQTYTFYQHLQTLSFSDVLLYVRSTPVHISAQGTVFSKFSETLYTFKEERLSKLSTVAPQNAQKTLQKDLKEFLRYRRSVICSTQVPIPSELRDKYKKKNFKAQWTAHHYGAQELLLTLITPK